MSPYWGANFFEFFKILFTRFFGGTLPTAADEIQIGVMSMVALACGLVGPFLVLKKMAMFANSLSHTILLGIVSAYLITSNLWGGGFFDAPTLILGSFIAALISALFTEGLVRLFRLQEEASTGFVFSTLFALGILLVTLFTRNVHLSTEAVMGNADSLTSIDFFNTSILALCNIGAVFLFYRQFQISSFDASYARTIGIRAKGFHFLLLFLATAVCVGAFRAVGILLVLAFLVGPYLTARLFFHRLHVLLILSPLFGITASFVGVALSRHILSVYHLPLSTGGIVVSMIGVFYGMGLLLKWMYVYSTVRKSTCVKELPS